MCYPIVLFVLCIQKIPITVTAERIQSLTTKFLPDLFCTLVIIQSFFTLGKFRI